MGDFQALSNRSTGRCHWCGPGGSRAPGTSCSAGEQPRGPERQLPEPPGRLSAPAPPRRRVPGRGGLGDTPTSPARGGQCAGLLPRGPRSPRCHRDRGRVRRGARGTARLARFPLPRIPGAAPVSSEARQESRRSAQAKAEHKGRWGGRRPERRGRRRRGRCCAAANPETGRPAARRVQAVRSVPASLSPLCPCPRASPAPRPEPAAAGASCSRLPGAARGGPAGPAAPFTFLPPAERRGPGRGGRLGPPPPAHPPSSDPSLPSPPSPHPLPRPRGAPGSQAAPGAPPREWRCPPAGCRGPQARVLRPGSAFWRRTRVLAPAGGFAGIHWLVLHWPAGSPPGHLALKVGLPNKLQSHGSPWKAQR